jgi:hypothetical protein
MSPSGLDVPPPLIGKISALDLGLSPEEQSDISDEWLRWWRRFVHVQGQIQLGDKFGSSRREEWSHAIVLARASVFDPFEGFESLEESPLLRDAALKTWQQGVEWSKQYQSQDMGHGSPLAKTVAESVIRERQVTPGRVRAGVLLLSVSGKWSNLPEPGLLLCSDEAYADEGLYAAELKKAFEAGLTRPIE